MKHTKFLAVFAVLVMVLGCMTCIVVTSENNSGSDLSDAGTVVLDPTMGFNSNKSELKKLGITDPSCWKVDMAGTTLVLDNVDYSTNDNIGISINCRNGTCANFNIVLKGENKISCGENKKAEFIDAILITDKVTNTTITGDGKLIIECKGVYDIHNGGSALYVHNNLIVSKCTLIAVGPTLHQNDDVKGRYSSNGIYVGSGDMTVKDGAKVFAYGGDVFAKGECYYEEKKHSTRSTGIFLGGISGTSKLFVKDSVVVGEGGDVESQAVGFGKDSVKHDVRSTGVYAPSSIMLENSILRGYGGTVTAITGEADKKISSEGLKFSGNIIAVDSEIYMCGGKAYSNNAAFSVGMRHFENLGDDEFASIITISLTNCDLYAYGYESTGVVTETKGSYGGSFGLLASEIGKGASDFDLMIKLDDSIAVFDGFGNYKGNSVGIKIVSYTTSEQSMTIEKKGTIYVKDSEVYANGHTQAISAREVKSLGFKYCYVGGEPYSRDREATPNMLTHERAKSAVIGFHYNVFALMDMNVYSPIKSYAFDSAEIRLPNYEIGITPEGQKFKCWSIEGKEYRPGDVFDLSDGPLTIVAVFEKDSGSDSNLVWIVVLVIAIIIALLFILIIALRNPSSTKGSEPKQVKKTSKPKRVAKPKATAKKAPAKKPAAKKTSKPKAKAKK